MNHKIMRTTNNLFTLKLNAKKKGLIWNEKRRYGNFK